MIRKQTTVVQLSPEDVIFLWDAGICVEDPEHFLIEEYYVMELDGRCSALRRLQEPERARTLVVRFLPVSFRVVRITAEIRRGASSFRQSDF
jgi:hypothetical protein